MLKLTNEILEIIKESKAVIHVINALEKIHNRRYRQGTINSFIKRNNIDISHFTGQGYLKGKTPPNAKLKYPIEDYLSNRRPIHSSSLKKKLIKENLLKEECSECKRTEWLGDKIPIELDHINGNPKDNSLSNLRILCPNCHAQTDNYCGKNI